MFLIPNKWIAALFHLMKIAMLLFLLRFRTKCARCAHRFNRTQIVRVFLVVFFFFFFAKDFDWIFVTELMNSCTGYYDHYVTWNWTIQTMSFEKFDWHVVETLDCCNSHTLFLSFLLFFFYGANYANQRINSTNSEEDHRDLNAITDIDHDQNQNVKYAFNCIFLCWSSIQTPHDMQSKQSIYNQSEIFIHRLRTYIGCTCIQAYSNNCRQCIYHGLLCNCHFHAVKCKMLARLKNGRIRFLLGNMRVFC